MKYFMHDVTTAAWVGKISVK